ncbi:plasmid replication protein RepC [Oryzifoliimicrobium ureilyticus]|uniref:plasmid replication protein RepC n=1 Tax=Oryzifoliimicrobium ureilyticus TaxID=3113724 RepID=UPI00307663FF
MFISHVTTPVGRGPMSLAQISRQVSAHELTKGSKVDKWAIYRALCEAKKVFELSDRTLALLNALLSFHPKPELIEGDQLIVFPSNQQLSSRAHGMAEQTIRRHIAALVNAGFILRYDSPNGKRYARKERNGKVFQAFGFSLVPLLARQHEILDAADKVRADKLRLQSLKDNLTLAKRDILKLLDTAAISEPLENHAPLKNAFEVVIANASRTANANDIAQTLAELVEIKNSLVKLLIRNNKTEIMSANPYQNERHQESHESESLKEERAKSLRLQNRQHTLQENANTSHRSSNSKPTYTKQFSPGQKQTQPEAAPLDVILRHCPEIVAYGPSGNIASWNDFLSACSVVRSMIGLPLSTFEQACNVMGRVNAATIIACILQRFDKIDVPQAYFQHLLRKTGEGKFSVTDLLNSTLHDGSRERQL